MRRIAPRTAVYILIDVLLLAACAYHLPYLVQRGNLPFYVNELAGRLVVTEVADTMAAGGIRAGDHVEPLDPAFHISYHMLEFFTDFYRAGDSLVFSVSQHGVSSQRVVTLLPYYPVHSIIMFCVVGLATWCVAVFVLLARPPNLTGSVLHWALMSMAVIVVMAWSNVPANEWWPYISRFLFFLSYGGVITTALFFTTLFPRPKWGPVFLKSLVIYLPMTILTIGMMYFHSRALVLHSVPDYNAFEIFDNLFHILAPLYLGGMIVSLVHSYLNAETSGERKKLQWILWGMCVGPLPFMLLTTLPAFFIPGGLLSESYTIIFLVIIPIAFGISFVKYHVLDIEVVINRTTVYGIALGTVVAVYVIIVGVAAAIIGTYTVGTSAAGAVLVALLFEPARRRVQLFVDKQFFRVRYNFRTVLRRFSDDIKMCIDAKQLAELLIARTEEIIPVARAGIFLIRQSDMRLVVVAQRGFDSLERRTIRFQVEKLRTQLLLPVALDSKVEPGIAYESADDRVFKRWQMALVFPMKSATGEFVGFFVLGEKKSGERFSIEDVDLLVNAATEAGMEFERIALQRNLLEEQAEKERLVKLNQMKSDFVSNVSHEIRTPLTSIKMYAEMLGGGARPSEKKRRDYLQTIVGETERLDRLVSNILDSAKIERGVRQLHKQRTDLREIVTHVLATMKYQLDKHGFQLDYKKPQRPLLIHADPDAVAEVIMNLVDNAIKFSIKQKVLKVSLNRKPGRVLCSVRDKGSGISPEALTHLFERFYRDPASSAAVQGVGLGLPLVKHIMDEHRGGVDISSTLGKGTTVTLWFPVTE